MNCRKSYWVVSLVSCLLVLLLCVIYFATRRAGTSTTGYGPNPTTAELVAAVTERLTSIDSLYCECERQFSNSKKRTRFLYARSGDMWYYMEPTLDGRENTSCSDGNYEYTYLVRQPCENNKNWTGVQVHDPRKDRDSGPEGLLGTPYNLGRSVADVFKTATDVTKSVQGLPDGTTGFRLVAQGVASANPNARHRYTVAVTFDPIHDLLPCDVLVTTPANPNWSEGWKVLEYRQVLDERTGKKRWFPVSGVLEWSTPGSITTRLTIHDVRINSKLPSRLFRPEVPNGVTLTDCTSKGIDKATEAKLKLRIYRSPTLRERIAAEFSQPGTLGDRLDRVLRDARLRFQRVLIVSADPEADVCQQLYPLYFNDETVQEAFADYSLLSVDTGAEKVDVLAAALKVPPRTAQTGEKQPFLWVVDGNGTLLATADVRMISKDSQIDRQRLFDFLKANAPVLPDAETVLADALAKAVREEKRVLVEETGAYCGWCLVLGRFIEAHRKVLDQDYILVSIDRYRFRNGQQVMDRLRKSAGGIPWTAIVDSRGKVLVTSDGPKGNIGYPNTPERIEHFLKMLTTTARRLTPEQLAKLRNDLETAEAAKAVLAGTTPAPGKIAAQTERPNVRAAIPPAVEHATVAAEPDHTLFVRVVDTEDGPVEGVHVSTFANFSNKSKDFSPDESGWSYFPNVISDSKGMARITDKYGIKCIIARHVGRKLIAIESIRPEQVKETVTITMRPECRVHGRLTSKELGARGRKIGWSNVYLYLDNERGRPMSCQSEKAQFHFYVSPGTYKLDAYSMVTHGVWKTITVKRGQQELEIEPIDMPPTRLAMLEGQPAPELQDVVAWKNSGPIRVADLRGKVVLLEFWGYWCGPCVGDMPKVFSIYDKYRDQGLVIIGVHVDVGQKIDSVAALDGKLADIKKRLWKDRDIPFPVALVLEHRVPYRPDIKAKAACPLVAAYGITGYPTGVLINRQGQVVGQFSTGHEADQAVLEKVLVEK